MYSTVHTLWKCPVSVDVSVWVWQPLPLPLPQSHHSVFQPEQKDFSQCFTHFNHFSHDTYDLPSITLYNPSVVTQTCLETLWHVNNYLRALCECRSEYLYISSSCGDGWPLLLTVFWGWDVDDSGLLPSQLYYPGSLASLAPWPPHSLRSQSRKTPVLIPCDGSDCH